CGGRRALPYAPQPSPARAFAPALRRGAHAGRARPLLPLRVLGGRRRRAVPPGTVRHGRRGSSPGVDRRLARRPSGQPVPARSVSRLPLRGPPDLCRPGLRQLHRGDAPRRPVAPRRRSVAHTAGLKPVGALLGRRLLAPLGLRRRAGLVALGCTQLALGIPGARRCPRMTAPRPAAPSAGYVALVLHAHLPFVRHPERAHQLEELWLFEAITETYLPLLNVMNGWVRDGVPFALTL